MSSPARNSPGSPREIADGSGQASAIASALGLCLDDIGVGRARGQVVAHPTCGSGLGSALALADLVLGVAVSSTVPGAWVQTLRLHASTAAPLAPMGGTLRAEARLATATSGSATSTAEVRADDGRVLVTLSCRCAVRPAAPGVVTRESWDIAAPTSSHEDPWLDLGLCTAHTAAEPALAAEPQLSNLAGVVQGGAIAATLTHACTDVLAYPPGHTSIDLDVAYLRGVAADGSRLPITVEVVHRGAQYGVARATLRDRDDRVATTATISAWSPRP